MTLLAPTVAVLGADLPAGPVPEGSLSTRAHLFVALATVVAILFVVRLVRRHESEVTSDVSVADRSVIWTNRRRHSRPEIP